MLSKKKGISPLVAVILLVVVAVILVTIILSFGKNFTTKSLDKTNNFGNLKKSDVGLFIYPKTYKDGTFQFTYSPANDLKGKEVIITHYQILEIPEMGTKEILAQTLSEGTNIFNLECLYEYHLLKPEFTVQLITSDNTYISIKQRDAGMVCTPEGTGTEVDPIMICNAEDLNGIKEDLNLNYSLGKDIDLQCFSRTEDETAGFLPIGDNTTKFSGSFNGNNKTISNLYINRPTTDNVGLFGVLNYQGSISNLILKDVEVTGQNYIGGLLGNIPNNYSEKYDEKGDGIFGNKVTGEVVGRDYVGGLVGYNNCSVFENNSFIGSVLGNDYVGGFLGYAKGIYRNNFSGGIVTGNDNVGGFGNFNGGTIENSYSTSNVNGNNNIGGFLGNITTGKLYNNYTTGDVNGNDYVGGFAGKAPGDGKYNNNYSTGDANGNNYVGGFIGYTAGGKFYNNYSIGNAYGIGNYVGGFVGEISWGKFYYNFSLGNVSGLDYLGGFTGSNNGIIINNYSKGNITRLSGEATNIGGLVGNNNYNLKNNYSIGKINYAGVSNPTDKGLAGVDAGGYCIYGNNYWDMNTSEQETSAGNAEGKTTLEMKSIPDENIFVDWDFVSIWRRDVSGTINGGYPYFDWQSTIKTGAIVSDFCDEELLLDSQNRYIIDTPGKLNCIRNNLSGDYVLGADIDLDVSPYNGGEGFEPIGIAFDSGQDFLGSLDGAGHTISNLYINRPTTDYVGLFGSTVNATINNLNLENVNIIGDSSVGGIVGYSRFGSISNSSISGNILGTSDVGGLIGDNQSPINNSYSSGYVSGTGNSIGGLVGSNSGLINNSHSSSVVSGINLVGGLIGYNSGNNIVSNNYSLGQVSGTQYVGGFVGRIYDGTSLNNYSLSNVIRSGGISTNLGGFVGNNDWLVGTKIINCYSSGSVSGEGWNPTNRGFSPYLYEADVSGLFWDMNTSGQLTNVAGATGKTTTEMMTQSTFTDWDFDTIWTIEEGESYPYLRTNEQLPHPEPFISVTAFPFPGIHKTVSLNVSLESAGDSMYYTTNGTEPDCNGVGTLYSSPITIITGTTTIKAIGCKEGYNPRVTSFTYILPEPNNIMTVEDLNNIRNNLTGFYVLGANIDLNVSPYNEGEGWLPIGDVVNPFTGNFDGNGYTISNLYINRPTTDNQGLFGVTLYATLTDINLENVSVSGTGNNIGSLVGYNDYTTILNCSSSGSVSSSGWYLGGLVGYNYHGTISNSSLSGSVSGTNWWYLGGLVGANDSGTITESFSTGTISGTNYIGGLVGSNSGTIIKSFSRGSVSGTGVVGGLVGVNYAIIYKSYSTGSVSGTDSIVGGLIGFSSSGGTVTENFSSGSVSGTNNVGGFIGQYDSPNGSISNNYSLGNVTRSSGSQTNYFGGFVGRFYSGTLTNNYSKGRVSGTGWNPTNKGFSGDTVTGSGNFWDMNTSLQTTSSSGATGKTTTEMKTESTFANWDLDTIWNITEGTTYPYLRSLTYDANNPLPQ